MSEWPITREYAVYEEDGRIGLYISADGLPQMTSVLPAPFRSESERVRIVEEARRSFALGGLWIMSERPMHNAAFDKRGEKTTTRFVTRPCRNSWEAELLRAKIRTFLQEIAAGVGSQPGEPVER